MKVSFKEGIYKDLPEALENSEPGTLLFCIDEGKLILKLEDNDKEEKSE